MICFQWAFMSLFGQPFKKENRWPILRKKILQSQSRTYDWYIMAGTVSSEQTVGIIRLLVLAECWDRNSSTSGEAVEGKAQQLFSAVNKEFISLILLKSCTLSSHIIWAMTLQHSVQLKN